MGSRSSSATSQNITTSDKRLALENSLGVSGDNSSITTSSTTYNNQDFSDRSVNNITTTDFGSVKEAMNLGGKALSSMLDSQRVATEFSNKTVDSAMKAIGETNHISETISKSAIDKIAETSRLAQSNVANAWENAKTAEAGKSMGDFKYIIFGLIGVFALLAYKRG